MKENLYENTKLATYLLWEQTRSDNAINLWYCTEDIAFYLYLNGIETVRDIFDIIIKGKESFEYILLIRNLSYRIFVYTNNYNSQINWYAAEHLVSNREWCNAIASIVSEYKAAGEDGGVLNSIKLKKVRDNLNVK